MFWEKPKILGYHDSIGEWHEYTPKKIIKGMQLIIVDRKEAICKKEKFLVPIPCHITDEGLIIRNHYDNVSYLKSFEKQ